MIIPGVGYETSSGGPFFRGKDLMIKTSDIVDVDDFVQTSTTRVVPNRNSTST